MGSDKTLNSASGDSLTAIESAADVFNLIGDFGNDHFYIHIYIYKTYLLLLFSVTAYTL